RSVHEQVHLLAWDQSSDEQHPYPSANAGRHRKGRREWFHNGVADDRHSVPRVVVLRALCRGLFAIHQQSGGEPIEARSRPFDRSTIEPLRLAPSPSLGPEVALLSRDSKRDERNPRRDVVHVAMEDEAIVSMAIQPDVADAAVLPAESGD